MRTIARKPTATPAAGGAEDSKQRRPKPVLPQVAPGQVSGDLSEELREASRKPAAEVAGFAVLSKQKAAKKWADGGTPLAVKVGGHFAGKSGERGDIPALCCLCASFFSGKVESADTLSP